MVNFQSLIPKWFIFDLKKPIISLLLIKMKFTVESYWLRFYFSLCYFTYKRCLCVLQTLSNECQMAYNAFIEQCFSSGWALNLCKAISNSWPLQSPVTFKRVSEVVFPIIHFAAAVSGHAHFLLHYSPLVLISHLSNSRGMSFPLCITLSCVFHISAMCVC